MAIAAKKLLVDGKITACVKQICLLGVVCKVSDRKTLSGEKFCFLEECLLSIFKFCTSSNLLFFYELLVGPQPTFLECIVICQLCLRGPGYSSRTVNVADRAVTKFSSRLVGGELNSKEGFFGSILLWFSKKVT